MQRLRVDVWSDLACPWCYIVKRRLEAALARFPDRERVDIVWRSFELDVGASQTSQPAGSLLPRLARKYRASLAEIEHMLQRMTVTAAAAGIETRFDRARPGSTFDAHRLLHHARALGRQSALKERLFRAYFTDGAALCDHGALARLAGEVGLDVTEARAVLASDAYRRDVRADEDLARHLGINGVPFLVIDGRPGISGARPIEALLAALTTAWADASVGDACGPDGCA